MSSAVVCLDDMDADPWANAPSSPKRFNDIETTPSKATTSSPLSIQQRPSTSTSPTLPPADSTEPDKQNENQDDEGSDAAAFSAPVMLGDGGDMTDEPTAEHDDIFEDVVEDVGAVGGGTDEIHENGAHDDFDDFDEPIDIPLESGIGGDEDGFGDFGDFEEGDFDEPNGTVPALLPVEQEPQWKALSLHPRPSTFQLLDQLTDLLEPLTAASSSSSVFTDAPPRSVGGLSQIMVSESSREAYAQLTTPPLLKPLDWTRSRTRREHLISMGVPVNLDEVDSHRLAALPPLRITTGANIPQPRRSETLDSKGRYTSAQKGKSRDMGIGRNSMPVGRVARGDGLGERPKMDVKRAEELCGVEEESLSILSLEKLKKLQEEIAGVSAQASGTLAWLLQLKDSQTQDSVTYNGMISELIANAAKAKSAQTAGSGGVFRRVSVRRPQSTSGTVTPRVASPATR